MKGNLRFKKKIFIASFLFVFLCFLFDILFFEVSKLLEDSYVVKVLFEVGLCLYLLIQVLINFLHQKRRDVNIFL